MVVEAWIYLDVELFIEIKEQFSWVGFLFP